LVPDDLCRCLPETRLLKYASGSKNPKNPKNLKNLKNLKHVP
jgi:hypothetical protein